MGIFLFLWFNFIVSSPSNSVAQPLAYPTPHPKAEELKRLRRCFGILTGERINPNHALYLSVSSNQENSKSGTAACMELLSYAELGSENVVAPENLALGSKILTQLTLFFRSTLFNKDPTVGMLTNKEIYDANESAYHWVYALLKPQEEAKNIITRSTALRSIRQSSRMNRTQSIQNLSTTVEFSQGNEASSQGPKTIQSWHPTLVPTGKLVGIKPDTIHNPVHLLSRFSSGFFPTPVTMPLETNLHYGSGMLGSQTYQHANNRVLESPDGLITPRAWAKAVFHDVLCRPLPTIRPADAAPRVRSHSTLPWAKTTSCQSCHIPMDGMAALNRNRVPVHTADGKGATFWYDLPQTKPIAPLPVDGPDSDFSRRPPTGALLFRNYRGELIHLELQGLGSLGAAIAEQDDFYVCIAKRIFEKLTGIETDLRDLGDPTHTSPLTPNETFFRNLVISHGLKLKQTQSLRTLVHDIILSDYFIHPDRGRQE